MKHRTLRLPAALGALVVATLSACQLSPLRPASPGAEGVATAVATVAGPAAETAVAAAPIAVGTAGSAAATAAAIVPAAATRAAAAIPSPAIATAVPGAPIRITNVRFGLPDSTIAIRNISGSSVDLTGWKLSIGTASAPLPSGARLAADETLTIHTGSGANTAGDVYLGPDAIALVPGLRPGATGALVDPRGDRVAEFSMPG